MTQTKLAIFLCVAVNIVPGHLYSVSPPDVSAKHPEDCQCQYCQNNNERYNMPMIESRIFDQKPYASPNNTSEEEDQHSIPTYFFDKPEKHSKIAIEKTNGKVFKYSDLSSKELVRNNTEKSCSQSQVDVVTPEILPDIFASLENTAHSTVSRESIMEDPSIITDAASRAESNLSLNAPVLQNIEFEEFLPKVISKENSENVASKPKMDENKERPEIEGVEDIKAFLKDSSDFTTVAETSTSRLLNTEKNNNLPITNEAEKKYKTSNTQRKKTNLSKTVEEGETEKSKEEEENSVKKKNNIRTENAEMVDKIEKMFNKLLKNLVKRNKCTGCKEKDIISENSLESIREIVHSLRRNVRVLGNGWVFRGEGMAHQGVVNEIVAAIENETPRSIQTMLDAGWRLEAAQALYIFLTRLDQPLIPFSIQSLVLDNNNRNISPEVVAADVLGLIREELSSRHRTLIGLILDLLDCSIKLSPADELRGHTLPVSMLPLFFNIENHHFLNEWRRILTIFVELIRQGSHALN